MINGKASSWESITINGPHGAMYDVTEISYKDKRAVNRLYGKGSRPRAFSRGRYEADGKLVMRREEYQRMKARAPKGVYAMEPFDITVSRSDDGGPTLTDVLQQCLIEARDFGIKEGDESDMVSLDFQILGDIADGGSAPFPETR